MTNHSVALFAEACGGTDSLRLNVEGRDGQESMYRILQQPFALVGRDPRADVLLSHPDVSQRHVYLQRIAGRIFCTDLESRTGIHWENGRQRSAWIHYGQSLRVGPYRICPVLDDLGLPPPTSAQMDQAAARFLEANTLPEVTLEFANKRKTPTWRMTPLLALVGRSQECRVHLLGRSVSSYHCSLVRTPLGLWIIDLFGRGGVWVNDVMVRCIRLDEGDRIRVGKFHIRVHYETSPSTSLHCAWQAVPFPDRAEAVEAGDKGAFSADPTQPQLDQLSSASQPTEVTGELIKNESAPAAMPGGTKLLPVPIDFQLGQGHGAEAVLVPIARQLSLMQQQMFDQFQQAMMMMFQMFNTLHRDQLNVIREELEKLHELTDEIRTLQAQLNQHSHSREAQPAPAPGPAPRAEPSPRHAFKQPAGFGQVKDQGTAPDHLGAESLKPVASAASKLRSSPPPQMTDTEMHAWLNQRIQTIQEERQSHWKRILSFLSGKQGEGPAP